MRSLRFPRSLLFTLLLFVTSLSFGQSTVTVSADLKTLFGVSQVNNAKVCFSLIDGQGNPIQDPRVSGSLLINTANVCAVPDGTGHISTQIEPNDLITPIGSQYAVEEILNGQFIHGDNFTFSSGGSYNLNTMTPNASVTIPVSPQPTSGSQSAICTFPFAVSTWTCVENMGTMQVISEFFDANGKQIFPDSAQATDLNTFTGTWVAPQAGSMKVVNVGNWTPSALFPNYIIGNPSAPQTITGQGLTLTSSAPLTVNGTGTFANFENIRSCDGQTGADWVAKCNAADTALGVTPGIIWLNNAAGLSATSGALNISANHVLMCVQGGVYVTNNQINLNGVGSGISTFNAAALGIGNLTNGCVFQEASGANLTSFVHVTSTGQQNFINGVQIDGNKANNPTEGVGVFVDKANQFVIRTTVQNFKSAGMYVTSTLLGNEGCCGAALESMFIYNDLDGILMVNSADWSISSHTWIEDNGIGTPLNVPNSVTTVTCATNTCTWVSGVKWTTDLSIVGTTLYLNGSPATRYTVLTVPSTTTMTLSPSPGTLTGVQLNWGNGVELNNSPTIRMSNCDMGGNATSGWVSYGTTTGRGNGGNLITNCQFGNNVDDDLLLFGYDTVGGGNTSQNNTFTNLGFNGTGKSPDATFPQMHLTDGGKSTIANNTFVTGGSPNRAKWGLLIDETAAGRAAPYSISGNTFGTLYSSGNMSDTTQNGGFAYIENQIRVNGTTGGTATSLDIFDVTPAAVFPHKYFRINGGSLQMLNSAFGAIIDTWTDNGTFSPGLKIQSPTANVATTGFLAMANSDKICHRNAGASADDCYGEIQTKRGVTGCTTPAVIGSSCATAITVTWPSAFLDTSYTAICQANGSPTNVPASPYVVTKTTSAITVNYFAITAAAASWPTIDCQGFHD